MIHQPDDQTIRTLKDYCQHDKDCRSHSWNYVDGRQPCTCGLDALIEAGASALHREAEEKLFVRASAPASPAKTEEETE